MFPRLFYNNFRRLKLHPLPNCLLNVPNVHTNSLVHSILLQQNIAQFSLSGPVATKKTELKTSTDKKVSKSATDDDRDEQSYLKLLNDPDTFGSSRDDVYFNESVDAGDIAEDEFIENPVSKKKRLSTKQYADMIKEHLSNKRIKEAIDVVEIRMIKEDRVKPENYIFNLLIGGCARVGYSKKAFNLFTKMKQRGLKVTGGTYTSLFNACSTCPWPQDGLNKAKRLREIMLEKGYEPNASNYNAMIKAFGRCGDITTAFLLVDEMKSKDLEIKVETFNFLLQACISDADYGFRHALIVWHKMYQRRLLPDVYSFNLMLRCVRDCSIGDIETMQQVISNILLGSKVDSDKQLKINDGQQLLIESKSDSDQKQTTELNETVDSVDQAPNLVTRFPHLGSLVVLNEVKKSEDRLLLLGGAKGILNEMEKLKVHPDVKTFTALLDIIPSTNTAEHQLIETIRKHKIKCDVDFFNILIKKRSMRMDYDGAKSVLDMIRIAGLEPDIVTYGVLALGCRNVQEARDLLTEMDIKGVRMNIQILGAMLKQGCYRRDFPYIIEIMKITKKERLKPNKQFLEHIDKFNYHCYNILKRPTDNPTRRAEFEADFKNFKSKLKQWKDFMGLNVKLDEAVKIVEEHPWEQFQSVQADGAEEVKHPKLRRKQKLSRHIKRLTPRKLGIDDVGSLTAK